MLKIVFTNEYTRRSKRFFKQHPELVDRYKKVMKLLSLDPSNSVLRLHKLKGSMKNLYSVSLNFSYRIILMFIIEDGVIIPVNIGSHDQVY